MIVIKYKIKFIKPQKIEHQMKVIIELVIIHYILKINARIILFNGLFNYLQLLQ